MQQEGAYGRAVRRLRRRRGVSQEWVAEKTGIDRGYLSRIENGKVNLPTYELRQKIAAAIGVPDSEVLTEAGLPARNHDDQVIAETHGPYDVTDAEETRSALHDLINGLHPRKLGYALQTLTLIDRSTLQGFE